MAKIEQVKRVSISNHFHLTSITENESQGHHLDGDDVPLFLSISFKAPKILATPEMKEKETAIVDNSFFNLSKKKKKRIVKYNEILRRLKQWEIVTDPPWSVMRVVGSPVQSTVSAPCPGSSP